MNVRKIVPVVAAIGATAAFFAYLKATDKERLESAANYAVQHRPMPGWKVLQGSPMHLFLYEDPTSGLRISGTRTQVVANVNPTPHLDRDGIAAEMLKLTHQNLPGWSGTMLGTIDGRNCTFRLVRREREGRRVINAFAVKGNTTLIVTMSATDEKIQRMDEALGPFKSFLATIGFERVHYRKENRPR